KVNHGIELIRQAGFKVVTLSLSARQIDNANRAFQSRVAKTVIGISQRQQEIRDVSMMKRCFVTIFESRPHALAFRRAIPVRSCRNGPFISCEPNEYCL